MTLRRLAAAGLATLAASGCAIQTVPHGRFAALSTRVAPVLGFQLDGLPRTRNVEAVVLSQHFLWVPTKTSPPLLEQAVEEALRRGDGDLLLDVEVDRIFFAIPLIYAQEGWRVRGDVVRTRVPEAAPPQVPMNEPVEPPPARGEPPEPPPASW